MSFGGKICTKTISFEKTSVPILRKSVSNESRGHTQKQPESKVAMYQLKCLFSTDIFLSFVTFQNYNYLWPSFKEYIVFNKECRGGERGLN